MKTNLSDGLRWLAQAQHDVEAAALAGREGFPETACFLAQQATDKALKGFLYTQGERPVMGHATHRLVERCAEYEHGFSDLLDVCRQLDQYYIPTRYPNGLPDGIPHDVYTLAQAQQAVEGARTVLRAVSTHLESLRNDG